MPSLFRFLIVLVILGILGGAGMLYLSLFVAPNTREMTVRIPAERLRGHESQSQAEQQPEAGQPAQALQQ